MLETTLLEEKSKEIKNLGWIEAKGNGTSQVGITYEILLGKEPENFEWPDFYGIEIKTKTKNCFKNNSLSLFRATPDNTFLKSSVLFRRMEQKIKIIQSIMCFI